MSCELRDYSLSGQGFICFDKRRIQVGHEFHELHEEYKLNTDGLPAAMNTATLIALIWRIDTEGLPAAMNTG